MNKINENWFCLFCGGEFNHEMEYKEHECFTKNKTEIKNDKN